MKPIALLRSIYDQEGENQAFLITTQVDTYSDLFNYLDPSPIRRRDLDQDFLNYLDESSKDIPLRYPIQLRLILPDGERDVSKEERVTKGIRTYFIHWQLSIKQKIQTSYNRSLFYLLIGLLLLLSLNLFQLVTTESFILTLATEGISIGGWVFIWEAVAEVAFKARDLRKEMRRIQRSAQAPIEFKSAQ